MGYSRYVTFSNVIVLLLVGAGLAVGGISLRAYTIAKRLESTYGQQLAALRQDMDRIEDRLISVAESGAASERPPPSNVEETRRPLVGKATSATGGSGGMAESLRSQREELERLKGIIEGAGLEALSESGDVDLTFLKDMSERRSRMRVMASAREELVERSEGQHESDSTLYGAEIRALYERARARGGSDSDEKEREAAFDELLDRYPDSYAAASVIAEKALSASFSRDVASVEKYYDMLLSSDNEAARNVVTGRGMEAMPVIESYLAREYIQEGRYQDAEAIIDSLDENYSHSMVFTGRRSGQGPPFQPVSRVVEQLREALE